MCEVPKSMMEAGRRRQEVTVEGYRTLGVVSIFIAGVESQCLGLVSNHKDSKLGEAANALLLVGLLLSSLGAALSLLSARWFDLLRGDELEMLEYQWEYTQNPKGLIDIEAKCLGYETGDYKAVEERAAKVEYSRKDYLLAKTLN